MRNNSVRTLIVVLVLSLFMTLSIVNLQNSSANDDIKTAQTVNEPRIFQVLEYTFEQGGSDFEEYADDWKVIVQRENPDIIVASEASHWDPSDGSFQADIAEMNTWFPNEAPYRGVATVPTSQTDGQVVLSRFPIVSHNIIDNTFTLDDGSNFDISHKVMDAVINLFGQETHVVTSHFTCCGQGYAKRLQEQEAIMNYFDDLGDVPIIYSADFNSESPLDVGDLAAPYSTLTGDSADIIVNTSNPKASVIHNFTDVFRTLNPYDPGPTFLSDVYVSRIDHMYVNEWLVDYMAQSYVIDSYPEATRFGHIPLVGIFNLDHESYDIRPPTSPHALLVNVDVPNVKSTLTWNGNGEPDLFKYQIYRNVSSDRCLITEIPAAENSFVDSDLYELNNIYIYEMTSVDQLGNISPLSNPAYVNSSQSQVFKPGKPLVTATGVSGGIQIDWTLADNGGIAEINYIVRRASDVKADPVLTAQTSDTSYFYSVPGAPPGTPIYFWVIASNYVGDGDYSEMATSITVANNLNLNSQGFEQMDVQSEGPENNDISLHQGSNCPTPLNLIDLPVISTSTSETTTSNTEITSSSSITPVQTTSKTDESPLNIGIISLLMVNVMIATIIRHKKN